MTIPIDIAKSTRHSRITGDFAEALTLYWLSRDAFESARIDHTGIDLLARNRRTQELMGISVKSRSRYRGTEREAVSIPVAEFPKVAAACKVFGCAPYFAIVVDGGDWIKLFLTSMEHLQVVAKLGKGKVHWCMTEAHLAKYREDPDIKSVEFTVSAGSWWDEPHNNEMQLPKPAPSKRRGLRS